MSLDAQDWVWQHSESKGTARLVLLAIADKANGEDCSAYAGTTMLVRRTRAARSSVVVAVDKLIESGELAVVEGRKGPKGERVYRLPKARGHRRAPEEGGTKSGGPKSGPVQNPDPSENRTPGGTKSGPPRSENRTPTGPESGPHNAENACNAEETQGEPAADEREQPPAPIDIDGFALTDTMRRWAHRDGYAALVDIDHATAQFVSHYRSTGARRKSWPDAWQKWIRDDAKRAAQRTTPRTTPNSGAPSQNRHQQAADDMFDRAMARAQARMQQEVVQ